MKNIDIEQLLFYTMSHIVCNPIQLMHKTLTSYNLMKSYKLSNAKHSPLYSENRQYIGVNTYSSPKSDSANILRDMSAICGDMKKGLAKTKAKYGTTQKTD